MRVHLFLLDCSNLIKNGGTRENNGISRSLLFIPQSKMSTCHAGKAGA
jgi:hypothetical protein